jgi:hypothetical protein
MKVIYNLKAGLSNLSNYVLLILYILMHRLLKRTLNPELKLFMVEMQFIVIQII